MKKLLALLLALSMVFILAACGGGKSGQKETVTVTFDTDGGEAMEAQTLEKGSALVRPATPKKTGYIFDKWTLNGQEYEFGTAVNENIVLKATWVDPNSGNGGSQSGPLFTAKTLVELHIRKGPGTDYEIAGKLPAGSTIEVFETKEAGGYTWNRINDTEWVADDGTWLDKTPAGGGSDDGDSSSSDSGPYIELDTNYLSFDFSPEYVGSHTFTVSFYNGANPDSKVTFSYKRTWDAGGYIIGDTFYAEHVGKYILTATTEEGYSATCTIEVFGTELCAMIGAFYYKQEQQYRDALTLAEYYYFKNGYSDMKYVSSQCVMINSSGLSYYYDDDINAYIKGGDPGSDHYLSFYDPLNDVYSLQYHWSIGGAY